jgi:Ca2+-transporting ATPase
MKTGFSRHTPHIDVFMGGIAMKAYLESCEDVLKAQNTMQTGLSAAEAEKRLAEFGPNKLQEGKKKSTIEVFFSQFKDLLVIILIAAAVISMISGNTESTIVIFVVIILNAIHSIL